MPNSQMQIGSEQGALMALLVKLIGAKRILEIGTFTGYSSTAMALALPPDGRITCLDVSEEWTDVAREAWAEAGVADKVDLRLAPAAETLATLDETASTWPSSMPTSPATTPTTRSACGSCAPAGCS